MFDRVAVIGDSDLIFAFKALGIKVYSPKTLEEARQVLNRLEEENIGLCFLHERFFEPLAQEREIFERKFCPVITGFSDYRMITDYLNKRMREISVKATGSDSLVKGRE
jgi:vacuolar-type H+-ATPase subunit F/Vma7